MDCALISGIFQEHKVNLQKTSSGSGRNGWSKSSILHQVKSSIFVIFELVWNQWFWAGVPGPPTFEESANAWIFLYFALQFFKIKKE